MKKGLTELVFILDRSGSMGEFESDTIGGFTINKISKAQKQTKEELRAEKVIFVITTDGLENASKHYSSQKIKKMVSMQKEKYGWEFIFLGANMDAIKEASKFGIEEDRAVTYENDEEGVRLNYEIVSQALCQLRSAKERMDGSWKEKIERRG